MTRKGQIFDSFQPDNPLAIYHTTYVNPQEHMNDLGRVLGFEVDGLTDWQETGADNFQGYWMVTLPKPDVRIDVYELEFDELKALVEQLRAENKTLREGNSGQLNCDYVFQGKALVRNDVYECSYCGDTKYLSGMHTTKPTRPCPKRVNGEHHIDELKAEVKVLREDNDKMRSVARNLWELIDANKLDDASASNALAEFDFREDK